MGHGRATKLVGRPIDLVSATADWRWRMIRLTMLFFRYMTHIAVRCFKLPLSCYFDDFVSFAMSGTCNEHAVQLCLMLDILGWSFDREGPKSDEFSDVVDDLEVPFHLGDNCNGVFEFLQYGEKGMRNPGPPGRGHG